MPEYGVLFDMDGVLVDSYGPHLESWQQTARPRGLVFTEDLFRATFGRTSRAIIRELVPDATDGFIHQWDHDKEALYRDLLADHFPAMDGAAELVAALAQDGFALAVGSSGPRENVSVLMERFPGAERFRGSVSGSDTTHSKPDPEVFLKTAEVLGLAPQRCVVVEDSLAGAEAGRRAGCAVVGLTSTSPRERLEPWADRVVDGLGELSPPALRELIDAPRP